MSATAVGRASKGVNEIAIEREGEKAHLPAEEFRIMAVEAAMLSSVADLRLMDIEERDIGVCSFETKGRENVGG